jgi:hypothetical protein
MEDLKIVKNITPDSLTLYGSQRIGFYDKIVNKGPEKGDVVTLYIYIENGNDNKTIVRRKSSIRKIRNKYGDLSPIDETVCFSRAYNKYLEIKNNIKDSPEEIRIRELEAKLEAQEEEGRSIPISLSKNIEENKKYQKKDSEKTIKELKYELDDLGCKYNVNSTKETLLELLYNNKK